jgi:hypothetical protein
MTRTFSLLCPCSVLNLTDHLCLMSEQTPPFEAAAFQSAELLIWHNIMSVPSYVLLSQHPNDSSLCCRRLVFRPSQARGTPNDLTGLGYLYIEMPRSGYDTSGFGHAGTRPAKKTEAAGQRSQASQGKAVSGTPQPQLGSCLTSVLALSEGQLRLRSYGRHRDARQAAKRQ